ncbi:MAG: hydroxymethylbilane synthase [Planctomycetes bacterium]|nr:hydroxymethylbilane synthase [Planctomycetota bacterium]
MIRLRIGTRGSDLALKQTRWVVERLRAAHTSLTVEEIVIKTHGDVATDQKIDSDWPVGGFVGAIEQALAGEHIDLAVHSYKDLQTAVTPGLVVAAVPKREATWDVLITRDDSDLDDLPDGFRVGTSSPRRAAQIRRLGDIEIVPIRGNVPTRIAKIEGERLDGVVVAAAGLIRLGINPLHRIDLPVDTFVPAPAQGALAVQTRSHSRVADMVTVLNDQLSRRAVETERGFLGAIHAGCHTPVGALATVEGMRISLHAQLFSDDGLHVAEGVEEGDDPQEVSQRLADRLLSMLR